MSAPRRTVRPPAISGTRAAPRQARLPPSARPLSLAHKLEFVSLDTCKYGRQLLRCHCRESFCSHRPLSGDRDRKDGSGCGRVRARRRTMSVLRRGQPALTAPAATMRSPSQCRCVVSTGRLGGRSGRSGGPPGFRRSPPSSGRPTSAHHRGLPHPGRGTHPRVGARRLARISWRSDGGR